MSRYLSAQGYKVSTASGGAAMRTIMADTPVDLVLLDLGLPDEDGLSLMRELRERSNAAIIVVTGRGDPVDRIVGLEVGADDYITKPFEIRELAARVRSVLRRTMTELPQSDATGGSSDVVRFAGWTFSLAGRELRTAGGEPVDLTTGEFDLLAALIRAPGRVLSRDELLESTRNRESGPFDRAIDVLVGRLRRKIEADPQRPELIKSVRGAGYVFTSKIQRS